MSPTIAVGCEHRLVRSRAIRKHHCGVRQKSSTLGHGDMSLDRPTSLALSRDRRCGDRRLLRRVGLPRCRMDRPR